MSCEVLPHDSLHNHGASARGWAGGPGEPGTEDTAQGQACAPSTTGHLLGIHPLYPWNLAHSLQKGQGCWSGPGGLRLTPHTTTRGHLEPTVCLGAWRAGT